jgi:hypothetical protein
VLVRECETVQDEMDWIADKLARLRDKHVRLPWHLHAFLRLRPQPAYRARPIAVLFRSLRTDAEALEQALQRVCDFPARAVALTAQYCVSAEGTVGAHGKRRARSRRQRRPRTCCGGRSVSVPAPAGQRKVRLSLCEVAC